MTNVILQDARALLKNTPASDAVPIGNLHLARATQLSLTNKGINHLKDLIPLLEDARRVTDDLKESLSVLIDSTSDNIIDWPLYWRGRGIRVIGQSSPTCHNHIESLPRLIREILSIEAKNSERGERAWFVIQHRFGLEGVDRYTLEQLGEALNLTRERVRQIEQKALKWTHEVLVDNMYIGKTYRVDEDVLNMMRQVCREGFGSLVSDTVLNHRAGTIWQLDKERMQYWRPIFDLLGELSSHKHIEFFYPDISPIWIDTAIWDSVTIEKWVMGIHHYLTNTVAVAVDELRVYTEVGNKMRNKGGLDLVQFKEILSHVSTVERDGNGKVQAVFAFLEGRGNQVERLLEERKNAMSIADLTREINSYMVRFDKKIVTEDNLRNQLIGDKRGSG